MPESSPAPRGNYFAALPVRVPADWMEAIKTGAPEELRWFHTDDLHLTLAFFGREEEERIPPLLDLLREIPYSGGRALPGRLLALPSPRRFSAISFELERGGEAISEIIANWRPKLLELAGCDPDPRPPLPHLTIARPDRKRRSHSKRAILEWLEKLTSPPDEIEILSPALYGWSEDRPRRQFRRIGGEDGGFPNDPA